MARSSSTRHHRFSWKWILILSILIELVVTTSGGYEVLFMMPLGTRSHKHGLYPIAEELGKRGHQVTFYSTFVEKTASTGVRNVLMPPANENNSFFANFNFFERSQMSTMSNWEAVKRSHAIVCSLIEDMYEDPFVDDLIRNPRNSSTNSARYQVVVVDALFNEFCLPLAHHLGAHVVYASPTILPFTIAWSMNIPNPASYVPSAIILVDGEMDFWQRAFTAVTNFLLVQLRARIQLPSFDRRVRQFLPNSPAINDLERNVSFVLTNSHFSINPSSPTMPYHADVGGLHCRPALKLPKDLEDFMQSSGDYGVIYFAFGSIQQGKDIPEDVKKKFVGVFAELPQKVIWKHENEIEDLPGNVRLIDWAPQQDILGHTKVRLFITHCGGLSLQETSYHGVPILAFPLGAEQLSNAGNAIRLGIAEKLDWMTFSAEDLRNKIKIMLENPKYGENAKKMSRLVRDRPERPAELAAYWVEYVARHNGALHLKSGAENLNFFQYFLLDVISAIAVVVTIVVAGVSLVTAFLIRKLVSNLRRYSSLSKKTNN